MIIIDGTETWDDPGAGDTPLTLLCDIAERTTDVDGGFAKATISRAAVGWAIESLKAAHAGPETLATADKFAQVCAADDDELRALVTADPSFNSDTYRQDLAAGRIEFDWRRWSNGPKVSKASQDLSDEIIETMGDLTAPYSLFVVSATWAVNRVEDRLGIPAQTRWRPALGEMVLLGAHGVTDYAYRWSVDRAFEDVLHAFDPTLDRTTMRAIVAAAPTWNGTLSDLIASQERGKEEVAPNPNEATLLKYGWYWAAVWLDLNPGLTPWYERPSPRTV